MEPGLHHAAPRAAELEAAEKVAPHLKKMKLAIFTAVVMRGQHGLTPDEFQVRSNLIINTIRRRFTDMWVEGIIKPTETTRPNARGNQETVWVVGRDEKRVGTRETNDQIIARLQARVRELEARIS